MAFALALLVGSVARVAISRAARPRSLNSAFARRRVRRPPAMKLRVLGAMALCWEGAESVEVMRKGEQRVRIDYDTYREGAY